jgi:hypothetical protein
MKHYCLSTVLMIMMVMAIALPAWDCSANQSQNLNIISHSMTVQKFSSDAVQGLAVVSGQAQNTGTTIISSATITVEFYDKDAKPLNTSSTVFENLQPNSIWNFSIQYIGPDSWKASTYKLSTGTK